MPMPPPTETSAPAQIKQESICAGGEPCKAPLRLGCPSAEQQFCVLELTVFFFLFICFNITAGSDSLAVFQRFSRIDVAPAESEEVFLLQSHAVVRVNAQIIQLLAPGSFM